MRAVFTNAGSTGDLQPFFALAAEMKRHGHQPVFAVMPRLEASIRRLGFEFASVGPDIDQMALQRQVVDLWNSHSGVEGAIRTAWETYGTLLEKSLPSAFADLQNACLGADVLISGSLVPTARMLHELTGIPFVSVQLTHFGGKDVESARRLLAEPIHRFRAQFRLPPLEDPFRTDANSPQLALYAMSRFIRRPDPDWPEHYHVVGFFFMEEEDWQPPPDLADFMERGPAPIAVSFGSMTHRDPEAVTRLILAAVERVGCRAIVQHGWSGLAKDMPLPSSVYGSGFVPHSWLFDHAAAVVHHGGAGTTAAVWRSGVPAVIVDHAFDQRVWSTVANGLGLASEPVSIKALTVEDLAAALDQVLHDPGFRERAERFSTQIQSENGVKRARILIEEMIGRLGTRERPEPVAQGAGPGCRASHRKAFLKRKRVHPAS